MMFDRKHAVPATLFVGLVALAGCEKSQESAPSTNAAPVAEPSASTKPTANKETATEPATASSQPAPSEPASSQPATASSQPATAHAGSAVAEEDRIALDGITMVVPAGWVVEPIQPGPMAAKAVFRLPRAEGDDEDAEVRVTYFPKMKGMDDANIQRWLGQVKHSDGSSYTREEANVSVTESGSVRVTMLDMRGTVSATMRGEPKANHRMIAAIIDHPEGPHFAVAAGPEATMAKWHDEIVTFLKSASVKQAP